MLNLLKINTFLKTKYDGNYTKYNGGGGLIIRTSSQRWFNGLGTNHISKISIFQTGYGQTSSAELKSFDVDINDNQIIIIKIPKEDLDTRLKSLEIGVEDLINGAAESYSWTSFPYLGMGGWMYLDLWD